MSYVTFDARVCQLGEGPLWHPDRQQYFWFDITGRRLLSRTQDEALEWDLPEMASAAGWIDRDTLMIATETGLRRPPSVNCSRSTLTLATCRAAGRAFSA